MIHNIAAGLCLFVVAGVSFAAAGPQTRPTTRPTAHHDVGPDQFQAMLDKQVVLLDVRTPGEYQEGHIAGAVNLDISAKDFAQRIEKLPKDKTYLVYCGGGGRSTRACNALDKLAFPDVYNLTGGFRGWQKAGKPVEK